MPIDGTGGIERENLSFLFCVFIHYCCSVRPFRRHFPPTVWCPSVGSILHMAATKKRGTTGATSEDTTTTTTTTTTPSQGEAAATQANGANSDGVSVEALADGQLEVNLLDLGVSAEDIAAMRRIDTRIEEARRDQQQALEAEPSEPQMTTRAKGKQIMLTEA